MSNESKDATLQCVHILTVSFLSCHSIPDLIVIDYFNSYLNRPFHALMHSHSHAAVMRHNWFVLRILSVCISVEQTDFFCILLCCLFLLFCVSFQLKQKCRLTQRMVYHQMLVQTGRGRCIAKVNSSCNSDNP